MTIPPPQGSAGLWSALTERTRLRLFGAASLAAFAMSYWVGVTGAVLRTTASPLGIVSLELAGTPAVAERILTAWGETGIAAAQFNIQIDFLYLITYGIALSVGCAVSRVWWQRRSAAMARLGALLTWAMLIAACSDAAENAMMWQGMNDTTNALWPALARIFALVKFALLLAGLLYIMTGAFSRIGARRAVGSAPASEDV